MKFVFVVSDGDIIDSVWTDRADAIHRAEGLNAIINESNYTWEKFNVDSSSLLYEI